MRAMTRFRLFLLVLTAGLAAAPVAQSPGAVILITLDGARAEEIFGGLDTKIVASQLKQKHR